MIRVATLAALLLLPFLVSAGTNDAGLAFLAENAKKEGVNVLPSGLQYKILRAGEGVNHPTADSSCSCHYGGTLLDGSTFDSSYDRGSPTSFAPNQVIKGWTEAMQLMVEGDKWEMYIPSELGYGDNGSPPKIPGGDVLIFTMEIIEIMGDTVSAIKCDPKTKEGCNEKEIKYIEKYHSKVEKNEGFSANKEFERLRAMQGEKMKPELLQWIARRISILQKLGSKDEL